MVKTLSSKKSDVGVKVAIGISGGVDSAVAAALLKEWGYDVTGAYLQCWDFDRPGCGGDVDRNDAIHIATTLEIKFKHLDFIEEYRDLVMSYFYSEYEAGRTPNPDVLCNKEIKFGLFLDWALESGFDYVATGHYAGLKRITDASGNSCVQLLSGADKGKDQSYFLYRLNQDQLKHALFPLGDMQKEDVRKKAKEVGFRIYDKPDSTGICFIGEVNLQTFLKERVKAKRGDVLSIEGNVIGYHEGAWFYTIGQRHGFTVTEYAGRPLYVVDKDVNNNQLVVGSKEDASKDIFYVNDLNWICEKPVLPFESLVRIRNLGKFYSAKISMGEGGQSEVITDEPLFGVAPGQSAVFYEDGRVLGGGIIV